MKDDFKQMRRDRDKYRDKFETIKEELEEIKRKHDRTTNELKKSQTQANRSSSPVLKRDDKRSQSRDSNSPEEFSKKSNEPINPRSSVISKKSSQNLRQENANK